MSWWESAYRSGRVSWDPGEYDGHLPWVLDEFDVSPCRALDIGCGTGKSAVWLAEHGFDVTGIDLAPTAIRRARELARERGVEATFVEGVFPDDAASGRAASAAVAGPFGFVTERAFLQHVGTGRALERTLRAIAGLMTPDGLFYSLIIAGPDVPRWWSMSRWTERDVREAMEPFFTVRAIRRTVFTPGEPGSMSAWLSVMERLW